MAIVATLMRMDMGRRLDDFTSDIIDHAIELQKTAGSRVAERFLDANHIDFDNIQRILFGPRHLLRAHDRSPNMPSDQVRCFRVNN